VLQLDDRHVDQVREATRRRGIKIAAIASPIGKAPVDAPFTHQLAQLERAIRVAQRLDTTYIRIFSYYPPAEPVGAAWPEAYRDRVLQHLGELLLRARAADLILLLENEKGIYGDTIARSVDLLHTLNDPHFRAVFDPANFIQCQQTPFPDAYEAIRPWLSYVHVKDATADGVVVAAGEGLAQWPALLHRLHSHEYKGYLSVESHLSATGQFEGFSGAQLVGYAARSLQQLLAAEDWEQA
jgi:sugar phosphate isomerase/epimerase